MSEEKSIEEQAREHCNLLQHPLCGIDIYSAFILGAKAQKKIDEREDEYAKKLASKLRWRTWPEEKPGSGFDIVIKRRHLRQYIIMTGLFESSWIRTIDSEAVLYLENDDKWMYLYDLEVVR